MAGASGEWETDILEGQEGFEPAVRPLVRALPQEWRNTRLAQAILENIPEVVAPAQAMQPGNLSPLATSMKLAQRSRPGFSEAAWSGPAGIGKFLTDLPEIFDTLLAKGVKVVPRESFTPIKQRIPFSKEQYATTYPYGVFEPPDPLMGTLGGIKVRDISPEGMEGAYTPIHQGFTVRHEVAHGADAIRQAIKEFMYKEQTLPAKDAKRLYNQIESYIPQTSQEYSEMLVDRAADIHGSVTPIEYGKLKGLTGAGQPRPKGLPDPLKDITQILKLGTLEAHIPIAGTPESQAAKIHGGTGIMETPRGKPSIPRSEKSHTRANFEQIKGLREDLAKQKAAKEAQEKIASLLDNVNKEGPLSTLYGEKSTPLDSATAEAIKKLFRGE